jgi:hypothetical protein
MRRREHERIVHEKDRTITRLERQNEDLLNRLMYAVDRTWTPPPRVEQDEPEPLEPYSWTPEQEFDAARD